VSEKRLLKVFFFLVAALDFLRSWLGGDSREKDSHGTISRFESFRGEEGEVRFGGKIFFDIFEKILCIFSKLI